MQKLKAVMTREWGCLDLPPHWFIRKHAVLRDTKGGFKGKVEQQNFSKWPDHLKFLDNHWPIYLHCFDHVHPDKFWDMQTPCQ
eukprot:s200_g27.t1